jgi:hypothetical protein
MEGVFAGGEESDSSKEKEWQDEEKEESYLTSKMNTATTQLNLNSDDKGSDFQENNVSVQSNNLDLHLQDYASNAQEVSSGEFDASYVKKYANPKNFLRALWNAAGLSAGAMVTWLDIIREELKGQLERVPTKFMNLPEQLISFMYKEAGEDPHKAITFITLVSN